jgi:hypothetical protein
MLIAGSTDGIYQINGINEGNTIETTKLYDTGEVFRICQFEAIEGLFAAADSGLCYSETGAEWTTLSLPENQVYAVTASPSGDLLYAGTRPAGLLVGECEDGVPTEEGDWEVVSGFQQLRAQNDWGIPRHDGLAQIRSLRTYPTATDRLIVGIEVGGIYVSDDSGRTWTERSIDGFDDVPHTDDIHHIELINKDTMVASTGSGLFRSADTGRTWRRLDTDHRQRYFREAFAHKGTIYAGGAPGSSSTWEGDADHALFECQDGERLEKVPSPTPEEVIVGWCKTEDKILAGTHRGTLLQRDSGGWQSIGRVIPNASTPVRYLPLSWYAP